MRVLCLKPIERSATELVAELAHEAPHVAELALISCEHGSKQVHFTWETGDDHDATTKIEWLIRHGWIPIAIMGVAKDNYHLLSRPLSEHTGKGIKKYLKKLMDKAARLYESGIGEGS